MFPIILAFIALGAILVYYFLRHDHGRKLPVESLWIAFAFGIGGIVVASFLETRFLPLKGLLNSYDRDLGKGFAVFMAVGFIEEAAKFIPLAFFIFKKNYFKEHTDGVIYFAICGLTFGLLENILYTVSLGAKAGLIRLVLMPFLHAATTGIIGYYLASYKINRTNRNKLVMACMAIPFIHGLYDFLLFSSIMPLTIMAFMVTLALSVGMFIYFSHANELDRMVLATVGNDPQNYCPICGRRNAHKSHYCEACGRRLA